MKEGNYFNCFTLHCVLRLTPTLVSNNKWSALIRERPSFCITKWLFCRTILASVCLIIFCNQENSLCFFINRFKNLLQVCCSSPWEFVVLSCCSLLLFSLHGNFQENLSMNQLTYSEGLNLRTAHGNIVWFCSFNWTLLKLRQHVYFE